MDPMKELVSEAVVERALLALLVAGPLLGAAGGLLWSVIRRAKPAWGLSRGLGLGLFGPLIWALWRLFSWLTRFAPAAQPEHDYYGLERVDILILNAVIFVAVGAAVGLAIRRVRERDARLGELNQLEISGTSSGEERAQQ